VSKSIERLQGIHRQAVADGMVKVGLPMSDGRGTEWCFGKRVSAIHARLDNVPVYCDGIGYGDVVEFREQDPPHELFKEFVRVVTRCSAKAMMPYSVPGVPEPESSRLYREARERLLALPEAIRPLAIEGVMPGWVALALPLGLSRSEFAAVARAVVPPELSPRWFAETAWRFSRQQTEVE
jgi:hypothetical protein